MKEENLKEVLSECEKTAKIGHKIVSSQTKNLNRTLTVAKENIRKTISDFNSSSYYSSGVTNLLEDQLIDIEKELDKLSISFKKDVKALKDNISKFKVTLFGRTMAGKSTLMEILTEGDGKTIGKGAQRTTRDVRRYIWNGLEITDVPGIGAFEGEEDEQIAFEAAKTADLILFLLTDDAPQIVEAECFSKIVKLGKPIICVVNIKVAISEEKSVKFINRDIQKKFEEKRLEDIKKQFLGYSVQFGQQWNHIPFVYVHLKSAYLAQHTEDPKRSNFYYQISYIGYLKKRIIKLIKTKGKFFRIKTFIDIISNPILESIGTLLAQSQLNSEQGRTISDKRRQLDKWKEKFQIDSKEQINSLIIKIGSKLDSEIAAFAEEHFSDSNADEEWNKCLKEQNIEKECQELLEKFEKKVNNELTEISREITNELKFTTSFETERILKMKKIFDEKKCWNWSTLIISGGLIATKIVATLVGATIAAPLGLIAVAVSAIGIIGSFFFDSRDKKEHEARIRLEKSLKKNKEKVCISLQKNMEKNLNKLIKTRIEGLMKEIDKVNSVIFQLADTQRKLAWELNEHLLELNIRIVTEAIKLIGAEGLQYHIQSVARIPGVSNAFLLQDGTVFPEKQEEDLYNLMAEQINFVYETENKKVLISRILGRKIDRKDINIEEKIGVAHIPFKELTPNMKNRVCLAQQLSKVHIMKSEESGC